MAKVISGFSKLSKKEKIDWLATNFFNNQNEIIETIKQYWNADEALHSRVHGKNHFKTESSGGEKSAFALTDIKKYCLGFPNYLVDFIL